MPRQTPFDMDHDTPLGEEATGTAMPVTHAPPPAATGGFPESTLSLRLDLDGVGISWTLRGDDSDVASRLPRVLDYIKRLQAKLPPGRSQGQARPEPSRAAAVPQPPLEEREDYCPMHGIAMLKQSNERGSWWSHRLPEGGYCKGKRRKAGA